MGGIKNYFRDIKNELKSLPKEDINRHAKIINLVFAILLSNWDWEKSSMIALIVVQIIFLACISLTHISQRQLEAFHMPQKAYIQKKHVSS